MTNSDTGILNFIATLATNTILFIMMLAGLLYVRLQGGGMLRLGDFLWKQVGGSTSPWLTLAVVLSLR
jgi:hypothetical protein